MMRRVDVDEFIASCARRKNRARNRGSPNRSIGVSTELWLKISRAAHKRGLTIEMVTTECVEAVIKIEKSKISSASRAAKSRELVSNGWIF